MRSLRVNVRLAVLVAAISAVLAFASLSPGGREGALADTTGQPNPFTITGVTCTDIYLDLAPLQVKGTAHGPEDLLIGKSLSRIEPTQPPEPKLFDLTAVTYLGPDLKTNDEPPFGDLIPDKPPTLLDCQDKATNGAAGPEANQMNPNVFFAMQSNHRPSTTGVLTKKPGGGVNEPPGPTWNLESVTCVFSEVNKQWVRTETDTVIINTGAGAKNFGTAVLNLGTDAPVNTIDVDGDTKPDVAVDPTECTDNPGTFPFSAVLESHGRNATTDHPEQPKNAGIAIDPDGALPNPPCTAHSLVNLKDKDVDECQDGKNEGGNFLADDWDGDGCPDWDELDKDFINGRDPFNPNDCGVNFTGAYTALATVQAATEGTGGSYFHAIAALQHNKGNNAITGALQVYLDSAFLDAAGPKNPVPTKSDGNPGAPPPPPYTTAAPSVINGFFDKGNQLLVLDFCVQDIGGVLAPNAIAHVEVDAHSLKGFVDIHGNQTQTACDAKTPNNTGPNVIKILNVPLQLAEQGINANHDMDLCTDMEELLGTGLATCGDDPYNPHDSDESFNSVGNLLITLYDCGTGALPNCGFDQGNDEIGGADWDKTLGEIIPGAYYHCITDTQHDMTTNALDARAFCYFDSTMPGICQINVEAYPGVCGDGIEGAGPPWPASKNAAPYEEAWGDVADNQTQLTGTYNPVLHELNLAGCLEADKDGAGARGNVYVDATIDAATGQGSVELTLKIDTVANCQAGITASGLLFPIEKIEIVEQASKTGQGAGYDTDRDGCSDKEELTDNEILGGLRDPYKYWDFFDPSQNLSVSLGDFLAVLSRFGSSDLNNTTAINRHTDPLSRPPPPPAYHPLSDRGGQQPGANGWNELPPDGQIALGDFLSLLRQFGHTCSSGPNDPKYPYKP